MQEYWVNVYKGVQPFNCHKHTNKKDAIENNLSMTYDKAIYRIHIKCFDNIKIERSYPYVWKDGKSVVNSKVNGWGYDLND